MASCSSVQSAPDESAKTVPPSLDSSGSRLALIAAPTYACRVYRVAWKSGLILSALRGHCWHSYRTLPAASGDRCSRSQAGDKRLELA
jgi:hypothetical protein